MAALIDAGHEVRLLIRSPDRGYRTDPAGGDAPGQVRWLHQTGQLTARQAGTATTTPS